MKIATTLSLVPSLRGGPWIYWDDLAYCFQHAKQLGYDGVELFTATTDVPDGLEDALEETGLSVAAVGTGAGKVMNGWTLTSPDADNRSQAKQFIKDMIDMGAGFNAPAIIGSMQGNDKSVDSGQAFEWLGEALEELGAYAGEQGTVLIYEPLNRYETVLFNTIEPAAKFVAGLDTDKVVLLADLFHMNIEEEDIADALRAAGPHVGHVHLADSNRRPGGLGHTDMDPIGEALRDIGYTGYVSAEAFCYPSQDEASQITMDCYEEYFKA